MHGLAVYKIWVRHLSYHYSSRIHYGSETQFYDLFEQQFSKQHEKYRENCCISPEKYDKTVETMNCEKVKN